MSLLGMGALPRPETTFIGTCLVYRHGSYYVGGSTCFATRRQRIMGMKVWIDQDLCTGDGLCEEIAPSVFTLLDDGLAYVREGTKVFSDPGGPEGLANVVEKDYDGTIESAEECPGECIFIEME
jgi:ferredoxin